MSSTLSLDQDDIARRLLKLQDSTGYDMVQKHGQRIYGGPPPEWSGPPPDKGTEVYCYRIPRDCFEDELVPVFSSVGRIYELRLMIEFSGTNRSYCYVRYTKQEDAREAIKKITNHHIRPGYPLAVTRSVDNRKLCIKALPPLDREIEEDVINELGNVVDGVNRIKYQTRGWLEVEFSTHRLAALARRQLVPGNVVLFESVEIKEVDWADPEGDCDGQESQGKIISVRNLPSSTNHLRLGDLFNNLSGGQVNGVVRSGNTVLVTFCTQEGAKFAMDRSCNLEMDGNRLEVTWWSQRRLDRGCYSSQPRSVPSNQPAGPVEQLHQVCAGQGWGTPQYSLTGARQDQVTGQQVYQCSVMVPGVSHSQVRGDWSVDREMARVSAAIRAMQGIVQASSELYTAQRSQQHHLPQSTVQMVPSDRQVLHPPPTAHFPRSHDQFNQPNQFLQSVGQFIPPPRHFLPPTSQPRPSSLFPTSQYTASNTFTMLGGITTTPQTRPPSRLLSRPDSPKPVLAVPPVHRTTSYTSLARVGAGVGGDLSMY
eukprot:GFUD01037943.1.p1 GENE.GFUD01037943.1~~GFUD01037943.1.p1  ORF type:complete len:538 (+),score=170.03 GFUD01037943.1:92-1705(+)